MIQIKRVYDAPSKSDGYRILVDRLWPRGVSKDRAKIDLWLKEVTPTDMLRKWYSHEPKKWPEFQKMYKEELMQRLDTLDRIKQIEKEKKIVTLVYAAKDTKRTHALVILDALKKIN